MEKVLIALVLAPALVAQWQMMTPATPPPPQHTGPIVFDAGRGAVVMVGPGFTNTYDGAAWSLLTTNGPTTTQPLLAYDSRRQVVVAYDSIARQTWHLTGSTWTQVVTANAPPALGSANMVFHEAAGVCVFFGGYNSNTNWRASSNETWHFDGTHWTQAAPGPGRDSFAMYYDAVRGVAVALPGINGYNRWPQLDTLVYDGTAWTSLGTAQIGSNGIVAFDPFRAHAVLLRNAASTSFEHFEVERTTARSRPTLTTWGQVRGLAFDARRNRMVAVAMPGLQTLELVPEAFARVFGQPCAGSGRTGGGLSATALPLLGQSMALQIDGLQNGEAALFVLGWSDRVQGTVSLPLPLDALGMPGCEQLVSADLAVFAVANGPSAAFLLPLPDVPPLVGLPLHAQGLHSAPGATPGNALVTAGLALVLGR